MKRLYLLLLTVLLALTASQVRSQSSSGNYRIPYADGILVTIIDDHNSHALPNRVDIQGIDTSTTVYSIRAAADGVVRAIRDSSPPNCASCTNYVWIEHGNGEWTGYFYLQSGSVTTGAGLTVGDSVTNGQFIGIESNRGSPGGSRLRFEVGVPTDASDPIVPLTGMVKGENRVPIICNVADNVLRKNVQYSALACFAQEFSYGTYRLPYSNNIQFQVNFDHLSHGPSKTRLDLVGQGGAGLNPTYPIVAAAAGQIMAIVDNNITSCNSNNSCANFNNYVWIRHANGEWTKYTHFMRGSVTTNAGLSVGMNVAAGRYLGDEGNVGFAGGDHLHFEVAVPTNTHLYTNAFQPDLTNAFQRLGGFINGINRIPLFCGVPGNIIRDGDVFLGGPCSGGGCTNDIVLPGKTIRGAEAHVAADTVDTSNNAILVDTYGSLALLAGNQVTLRPGFRAANRSYFRAAIRPCFNPP